MTIYTSTTTFLVAIGPYVTDRGHFVLWQDQPSQLFGLQRKDNLQDILALRLQVILQDLGIVQFYSKTVQRARVDTWLRVVEAAVTLDNSQFYYDILFGPASSHLAVGGSGSLSASLSVAAAAQVGVSGGSGFYADLTVTP